MTGYLQSIKFVFLQHSFGKLLIEVLCLGKESSDAQRLMNYKAPKTARAVSSFLSSLLAARET